MVDKLIVIIDYGLGNVFSVLNALNFLGVEAKISAEEKDIQSADKLILPGVGAFSQGMKLLEDKNLIPVLSEEVLVKKKPILGICLGMQLFAEISYEVGTHKGLGWIKNSSVEKIFVSKSTLKIPHVGWESISYTDNFLFEGLDDHPEFYFVHSFYLKGPIDVVTSTFDYDGNFTASVQQDNIFGTQFHPEKSQKNGLKLLKNFVDM